MVWGANAKDNAEPVRVEQAFPAIITKDQFNRVGMLMRSRAPKRSNPRRVGSTYLLSGLVKCKACNRALSGQDAKSGQFSYYACQSNHAPKGGVNIAKSVTRKMAFASDRPPRTHGRDRRALGRLTSLLANLPSLRRPQEGVPTSTP